MYVRMQVAKKQIKVLLHMYIRSYVYPVIGPFIVVSLTP